jgi:hypothetical protein
VDSAGWAEVRGLAQVSIHVALSFSAMLAVALAAVGLRRPDLVRGIKHFVAYLLLRTASLKDAVLGLSNCVGENVRVHCESWVNCMVKSGRFVSHWELR